MRTPPAIVASLSLSLLASSSFAQPEGVQAPWAAPDTLDPTPPVTALGPSALPSPAAPAVDPKPKDAKKKPKKSQDRRVNLLGDDGSMGRLEIGGRVFARGAFSSREFGATSTDSLNFSVSSARVDLFYEAPIPGLSVDIEFDISGNPEMKDAFVQAKGRNFFARAGQFKPPISAIEMESPWTLPLADRGFLNDLLLDYLDVAGRRPGVLLGWRGRGGIKPRLHAGVFQGSVRDEGDPLTGDRDVELVREWRQSGADWNQRLFEAQGLAARFDVEIERLSLGVFYQHRVGSPAYLRTKHYPTAGLDLVWDQKLGGGGVRLWADLIAGASWYEHPDKELDQKDAVFVSGRVLGAYRFGGTQDDQLYLEPFGMYGLLDPDTDLARDFAWEGVLGLNVGFWRRARLTLQGEINRAQRNFPNQSEGYLFGLNPDRLGLTLQAGVAF